MKGTNQAQPVSCAAILKELELLLQDTRPQEHDTVMHQLDQASNQDDTNHEAMSSGKA